MIIKDYILSKSQLPKDGTYTMLDHIQSSNIKVYAENVVLEPIVEETFEITIIEEYEEIIIEEESFSFTL